MISANTTYRAMLAGLEVLRTGTDNPELPAQAMITLLQVALRGDDHPTILELGKFTGLSDGSASRMAYLLGDGYPNRPGLGLLESKPDPLHRSRKLVRLTPKGQSLMYDLREALGKALGE